MRAESRIQSSATSREIILNSHAWTVSASYTATSAAKNLYIEIPDDGHNYFLTIGGVSSEPDYFRELIEDVTQSGSIGTQLIPVNQNRKSPEVFYGLAGKNVGYTDGTVIYKNQYHPRGYAWDIGAGTPPTMVQITSGKKYIILHTPGAESAFTITATIYKELNRVKLFSALVYPIVQPIWYSTLNDDAAITSPAIGSGATISGALTYAAAKYATGADFDAASKYISIPVTFGEEGCVEFWAKTKGLPATYSNTYWTYANSPGLLLWSFSVAGDPAGAGLLNYIGAGIATFYASVPFASGDTLHFAISWSSSGAMTGGATNRFFVNNAAGTVISGSETSAGAMPEITPFVFGAFAGSASADLIVENLKIWDYAKEDFSDA
jgi:hypothetical protein